MKKCASQDICQRYKDGRCDLLKLMRLNISSCSQRELTAMGKTAVRKGERK
mgnify:CR=1 FL=1